jgi:hypothetical protein
MVETNLVVVERATKIVIQQATVSCIMYHGETKLKVVVLLSRVERDKTLGEEMSIPN